MANEKEPIERAAKLDALLYRNSDGNRRSIPEAIFLENIEGICVGRDSVEVLARLQELYTKYQYMQSSLVSQKASLKSKLPDITTALETVQHLLERREKMSESDNTEYTYQLSENIYAHAIVPPTNNVCLWLGANCMLEYTLEEALNLLKTNEANAKTTLASVEEDIAFLRDQITTTEVNIARTHNYGVKLRQDERAKLARDSGSEAPSIATQQPRPEAPAHNLEAQLPFGQGSGYTWKQQLDDIEVSVVAPSAARKEDVKVRFATDSLRVEYCGVVLVEGELAGKCSPSGCTWTLSNGRIDLTIEKADKKAWMSLFEAEAV